MLNFQAYPFAPAADGARPLFDLHTHTVFSDGHDTAEEMVLSAIDKGLACLGMSDHSFVEMDKSSMRPENFEAYRKEIARLKTAYRGRIEILCGLERDYYSEDLQEYDYVIGSVHWVMMPDGHRMAVDWTPDRLAHDVDKYFGGDWYAMTEAYYALEADVIRKTKCDIVGHFDLVTKFNEKGHFFDTNHPRYVAAWKQAADELLRARIPFEINTGAMSRGYRTEPYPAKDIRDYIRARGGKLILSSDSHRKDTIAYRFGEYAGEADEAPF